MIRVLIADDHQIFREGLSALLSNYPEMQVIAEAENGRQAVRLAQMHLPDVAIIDVEMPELNGLDAIRDIHVFHPDCKAIVLSIHMDRHSVIDALRTGATGYLVKNCSFREVHQAILAVTTNQSYFSPEIARVVSDELLGVPDAGASSAHSILSERERDVLRLLAEGQSTKQIAQSIALSTKTIDAYRQQLMSKLNLHSVAELTKYAIRTGLTSL